MPELAWIALAVSVSMAALWLVQRARRDASLVDAGWAAGIGAAAIVLAALGHGDPVRRLVIGSLGACWSLRLTIHLLRDRVLGKPEDGRYAMLRATWGARAQRNFFLFFQLQAGFVVAFSCPFLAISADPRRFGSWTDLAGLALWVVALGIVTSADRQLARWRADPANHGRTCRGGLWRFSRHPNYFGEWLLWCSYILIAWSGPQWWLAPATALVLLVLLLGVTGIPYTEKRALASRGDDYRAYQRATSPFIPWFPKMERP
jgi:steroid 5-alpha reductase family enzyme